MENPVTKPGAEPRDAARAARFSLSKKLLGLTVLFVMVAEVLIYIPSIANFRNVWLQEKLDSAAVVAMAAHATPGVVFPPELEQQMLARIGVDAIAIRTGGQSLLIAPADMPPGEVLRYDLTELRPLESIASAFATLVSKRRQADDGERQAAGRQRTLRGAPARTAAAAGDDPLLPQHPAPVARHFRDHRGARLRGAARAHRAPDASDCRRAS